jgi:chorismate-pyruvate lyase
VQQIAALLAPFFPSLAAVGEFAPVAVDEAPANYRALLAHDDHMTVTVEAYHDCRADVRVLAAHRDGDVYSRNSLLVNLATSAVLQFGVMRIDLAGLAPGVRREVESGAAPLGRILIRHNVLRHVELRQLWQIVPGPVLQDRLDLASHAPLYGRTARIVVEGRPAVELLEIPKA